MIADAPFFHAAKLPRLAMVYQPQGGLGCSVLTKQVTPLCPDPQ